MISASRGRDRRPPVRFAKSRFRVRQWWIYRLRPRVRRVGISDRLPWAVWCALCASKASELIEQLARRVGRPLVFVQIGSNDGSANDPLRKTVRTRRWTGVLVEPIPAILARLKANYADVPGLSFSNVAVGERDERSTLFTIDPRPGDPEWTDQIASLDREVVLKHAYAIPDIDSRVKPMEVETVTLHTLVKRCDLRHIDLLHIDAEGLDAAIVRQVRPDAGWAPTYLLFEKKHMKPDEFLALKSGLRAAGYRFVDLGPDEFAYRSAPRPGT